MLSPGLTLVPAGSPQGPSSAAPAGRPLGPCLWESWEASHSPQPCSVSPRRVVPYAFVFGPPSGCTVSGGPRGKCPRLLP